MYVTKLRLVAVLSILAGVALTGAGVLAHQQAEPDQAAALPRASRPAPGDEPEVSPQTQAILAKLAQPVPMNFPNEAPLEDVLKYIKQETRAPGDDGIPIYVDPIGLVEAERTMTVPITIDLKGIPLRRTLQLILKQIGLAYFVDDGILVITSEDSITDETSLPPAIAKASPLLARQKKARRGELNAEEMAELIEQLKSVKQMESLIYLGGSEIREEGKPAASPMTSDQIKALLEQLKDLTTALKAAQDWPQNRERGFR